MNNLEYREHAIMLYGRNKLSNLETELKDLLMNKTKLNKNDICFRLYIVYSLIARIYYQNKNYAKCKSYSMEAVRYSSSVEEKAKSSWMLAVSLAELGNKDLAFKYYKDCYDYYDTINDYYNMAEILKNQALLTDNEELMLTSIKCYGKIDYEDNEFINEQELMDKAYKNLFIIYLENKKLLLAQKALTKIKDITMKNELRLKLY